MTSPSSYPRVTAIIKEAGLCDASWWTEYHRDKGSALHKATELLDRKDLDRSSVDPAIHGRLAAYERFLREVEPRIYSIEEEFVSEPYGYMGHRDRTLTINHRFGVLDVKPPTRYPWQGVQLAAYSVPLGPDVARWSLHLSDDGTYKLIEHTDRNDWRVFLAALSIYNWKLKHGLIEALGDTDGKQVVAV